MSRAAVRAELAERLEQLLGTTWHVLDRARLGREPLFPPACVISALRWRPAEYGGLFFADVQFVVSPLLELEEFDADVLDSLADDGGVLDLLESVGAASWVDLAVESADDVDEILLGVSLWRGLSVGLRIIPA